MEASSAKAVASLHRNAGSYGARYTSRRDAWRGSCAEAPSLVLSSRCFLSLLLVEDEVFHPTGPADIQRGYLCNVWTPRRKVLKHRRVTGDSPQAGVLIWESLRVARPERSARQNSAALRTRFQPRGIPAPPSRNSRPTSRQIASEDRLHEAPLGRDCDL